MLRVVTYHCQSARSLYIRRVRGARSLKRSYIADMDEMDCCRRHDPGDYLLDDTSGFKLLTRSSEALVADVL